MLIRGYLGTYSSSAGYNNLVIQSITWANGVYTIVGNTNNPSQFMSGFQLSRDYNALLQNLNPQAPTLNIAVPIGIASGALVLVVAIIMGTILLVRRRSRRRVLSDASETKTRMSLSNDLRSAIASLTAVSIPNLAEAWQRENREPPPTNESFVHKNQMSSRNIVPENLTEGHGMARSEFARAELAKAFPPVQIQRQSIAFMNNSRNPFQKNVFNIPPPLEPPPPPM
jgi:hypothetical protein